MNFEANRRKLMEDLKKQRDRKKIVPGKPSTPYVYHDQGAGLTKEIIVIFALKSFFMNNLAASLGQKYKFEIHYDVDKAIDFIIEHGVKFVIIDIDPPSDYHNAANFLTVAKTTSTNVMMFVCTKDKDASQARSLENYGGIILGKPVSIPEITEYLEHRKTV
jgi:hypothetical protein